MADNLKMASILELLNTPVQVDISKFSAMLCELGILTEEEKSKVDGIAIGMMIQEQMAAERRTK